MIQFKVLKVSRHKSSEVRTMRFTYKDDERSEKIIEGGEWEEIEFGVNVEDKPTIRISNIDGDGFLVGAPAKLIINNPDLFDKVKVGDLWDIVVLPLLLSTKKEDLS